MLQSGDVVSITLLQPCEEKWLKGIGLEAKKILTADSIRKLLQMPSEFLRESFGTDDLKEILLNNNDDDIAVTIEQYQRFGRIQKGTICRINGDPLHTSRYLIVTTEIAENDFHLCNCIDLNGYPWRGVEKVNLEPVGYTDLLSNALKEVAESVL